MRVLVCGGRNFAEVDNSPDEEFLKRTAEYKFVHDHLHNLSLGWPRTPEDEYGNWLPAVTIITGECPTGVDQAAIDWAVVNWTGYKGFPADWKTHGKAAGPIRNKQMLDEGKPDVVVAFPGGKGTANMVKLAREAGVPVTIVS